MCKMLKSHFRLNEVDFAKHSLYFFNSYITLKCFKNISLLLRLSKPQWHCCRINTAYRDSKLELRSDQQFVSSGNWADKMLSIISDNPFTAVQWKLKKKQQKNNNTETVREPIILMAIQNAWYGLAWLSLFPSCIAESSRTGEEDGGAQTGPKKKKKKTVEKKKVWTGMHITWGEDACSPAPSLVSCATQHQASWTWRTLRLDQAEKASGQSGQTTRLTEWQALRAKPRVIFQEC